MAAPPVEGPPNFCPTFAQVARRTRVRRAVNHPTTDNGRDLLAYRWISDSTLTSVPAATLEVAMQATETNPNDEIRRTILKYFYDQNANATSRFGKKGSAVKISDV